MYKYCTVQGYPHRKYHIIYIDRELRDPNDIYAVHDANYSAWRGL
jgi:hypothetical protein